MSMIISLVEVHTNCHIHATCHIHRGLCDITCLINYKDHVMTPKHSIDTH